MRDTYVHGYDELERTRLQDQARTLEDLLHADTVYPDGACVLEAGCGVGAQTVPLARNSPGARITAIDISPASLAAARERVAAANLRNVSFRQADVLALPFPSESFDHAFIRFLLEHLCRPQAALAEVMRVLKPGGTITAIEGDHGSVLFHPEDERARAAIRCEVELQGRAGGDAYLGRRLYPLLRDAGFHRVFVSPRMVYVDGGKPGLADGFVLRTFTAMIAGIREPAIAEGMMIAEEFDTGIAALRRTADVDGSFCYTFFRGTGMK